MLRRAILALALPILLLTPLLLAPGLAAAEGAPKHDVGQYVDLQPVGLPIVVGGRLVNYVFVYVRLNLTSSANAARWREKEPFFRDALVRAGHRTPFTLATDYQKIDEAKLTAALMREGAAITGPGVIRSVVVTSQTARGRATPPKARAAPNP
jgi:hypothetical protein